MSVVPDVIRQAYVWSSWCAPYRATPSMLVSELSRHARGRKQETRAILTVKRVRSCAHYKVCLSGEGRKALLIWEISSPRRRPR